MVTCDMFNVLHDIMLTVPKNETKEQIAQIIANGYRARTIPKGFSMIIETLANAVKNAPTTNSKIRALQEFKILIWRAANFETFIGRFQNIAALLVEEVFKEPMIDILKNALQILRQMGNYGPEDLQSQLKKDLVPERLIHIRDQPNSDGELKQLIDQLLRCLNAIRV
ncbi:MAG: hypothetical protein EZS28_023699 [Streblomastix strix]|uniref:Uncharacterized protein n=1 Tax=Streblomastix strix TaxID=222440 RepID=A0A5J4VEC0_9EUKA|nr:MAG: hypothetical protein EZS28_023699 [Streblomastix strix]